MTDDTAYLVEKMKRARLGLLYMEKLTAALDGVKLLPDSPPLHLGGVVAPDARMAARMACRQGYDAGRYDPETRCPYQGDSERVRWARRAWLIGHEKGLKVQPRPEPRVLDQKPVRLPA